MEVAVVVRLHDGDGVDLVIELDRDATVADFTGMALHAMRVRDDLRIFHVRTEQWLDPRARLGEAGIARADELIFATPATLIRSAPGRALDHNPAPMPFELAIVSGERAGNFTPLNYGTYRIGSDPRSDIVSNDPHVAPSHLVLEITRDHITVTPHAGRVIVDGQVVQRSATLSPGAWIEYGTTIAEVRLADTQVYARQSDSSGRVPFNRPPRHQHPDSQPEFRLIAPPADHKPRKIPLLVTLLPIVGALGAIVGMAAVQGHIGQPAKWPWQFAVFALLSPIMALGNWASERRTGKGEYTEQRKKFEHQVEDTATRIRSARQAEAVTRRANAPDLSALRARAVQLSPTLWERRIGDADAIALRVGCARTPSAIHVDIQEGGGEALRARALERTAPPEIMPFVPKSFTLRAYPAVGVAGNPEHVLGVTTSLVLQAATLHSPKELAICLAIPEESERSWDWCKWLPHCDPLAAPLSGPLIAVGAEASGDLIERLLALIERRRTQRSQYGGEATMELPLIVLVVDETVIRQRPRAARLLENAYAHGVRVIWVAHEARNLPGECGQYLEVQQPGAGIFHAPASGEPLVNLVLDECSESIAREVGLALAPIVDHTTASALGGGIPVMCRLTDLLGMPEPSTDGIVRRWSHPPRGLAAPVGEAADGPFVIDMRQDGPHGLVAGTTGAGKSELLQSFVVSLAATYPPTRLNFLFVDYKGGTAFSSCTELPHAVGMVTDLDGQLAQRVIISLNAELKRREHLLRETEARDLIDLETRRPHDAPPSLLLIIDEFAALAREVPDFIDGVVDIAQRGRSLGIHLLLATQRPNGVVNDNIRANTNLRVALRVADTQDSTDILGRDDAAHIPRTLPGRAFARTGQSDFTAFQAAWAGGIARVAAASSNRSIKIFKLSGPVTLWAETDMAESTPARTVTDLQLMCECIIDAAKRTEQPESVAPWLEPMGSVIPLESLVQPAIDPRDPAAVVAYGLVDVPSEQSQVTAFLNVEAGGNIAVFGASGAGKTTTLRTIAASASINAMPRDFVFYGIDGGAGGLEPLRNLPQCGGIVPTTNVELVTRVISRIEHEVAKRRELLATLGAGSLGDLRARTLPDEVVAPPRLMLIIDNFGSFVTAFEKIEFGRWIDVIQQLATEGRPLGIHLVISTDRRNSVPSGLVGVISDRIVLRAVDADEMSALGVPYKIALSAKLRDGRALLGETEVQCAIVGTDPSNEQQTNALIALGAALRERAAGATAPTITGLPDAFSLRQIPAGPDALHPWIGVTDLPEGLAAVGLDFTAGNVLVTGRKNSGQTSALQTIAQGIMRTGGVEIHALCPRPSALAAMPGLTTATVGELAIVDALGVLQERAESHSSTTPIVVLFDDADLFSDHPAAGDIERLLTGPGRNALRLVIALDPATIQHSYMGWVSATKRFASVLALRPELETDADLYGPRLTGRPGQRFPAGRGFLIFERAPRAIQVALPIEIPAAAGQPTPGPLLRTPVPGLSVPPNPGTSQWSAPPS
ncbi:MAG: FtsK/SpoIIIE domain-containing protein [Acidimicrobiia bacterium]